MEIRFTGTLDIAETIAGADGIELREPQISKEELSRGVLAFLERAIANEAGTRDDRVPGRLCITHGYVTAVKNGSTVSSSRRPAPSATVLVTFKPTLKVDETVPRPRRNLKENRFLSAARDHLERALHAAARADGGLIVGNETVDCDFSLGVFGHSFYLPDSDSPEFQGIAF